MSRRLAPIGLALLGIVCAIPAGAEPTHLHLGESATVMAAPDEIVASLRAEAIAGAPAEVQKRVNETIRDALALAQAAPGVTVSTGGYAVWRTQQNGAARWQGGQSLNLTSGDAAVLLMDQLKEIWIDGELELIETATWVPKLIRREYQIALSVVGNGVDDPDQQFYENYVCGSRTYMGYCDKELDALVDRQSAEPDQKKRQEIVWQIDRKLQQDAVRPILYYLRGATCRRPEVKGVTVMVNSIFNGWRMEDVWLDR